MSEREHTLNRDCWCNPQIEITAGNGKSKNDTSATVIHNQVTGDDRMSGAEE